MDKHKPTLLIEDIQVGQVWTHMVTIPEVYGKKHYHLVILIASFNGVSYTIFSLEGKKAENEPSPQYDIIIRDFSKDDLCGLLTRNGYKQNDLEFLVKYGCPIEVLRQSIKQRRNQAMEEAQKFDSWLELVNRTGGLK